MPPPKISGPLELLLQPFGFHPLLQRLYALLLVFTLFLQQCGFGRFGIIYLRDANGRDCANNKYGECGGSRIAGKEFRHLEATADGSNRSAIGYGQLCTARPYFMNKRKKHREADDDESKRRN